jgi:hypothetical protein
MLERSLSKRPLPAAGWNHAHQAFDLVGTPIPDMLPTIEGEQSSLNQLNGGQLPMRCPDRRNGGIVWGGGCHCKYHIAPPDLTSEILPFTQYGCLPKRP